VGWSSGNFRFVLGDVKPIDDLAMVPGDVVSHLNLDTQMVLLDAMRIFDERNRDTTRPEPRPRAGAGGAAAGSVLKRASASRT
jgi:hypothetical protein